MNYFYLSSEIMLKCHQYLIICTRLQTVKPGVVNMSAATGAIFQ